MKPTSNPGSRRKGGSTSQTAAKATPRRGEGHRVKDLSAPGAGEEGHRKATRPTAGRTTARTGGGNSGAPRSPAPPRDAGAARRAAKRAECRRRNSLIWGVVTVITIISCATAAGVYSETKWVQEKIALKHDTLVDIKAQDEAGTKRLKALTDSGGRVRALVENGFIKPGQRLLLMERSSQEKKAAARKPNDLVKQPEPEAPGFTARLGRAWKELRGG